MITQIACKPIDETFPTIHRTLAPYETRETWPSGKTVFVEGEPTTGIYFLYDGQVDLTFAARNGETKPLLIAEPGQILGLCAVVAGRPHDSSATTRTPTIAGFVDKQRFLGLLDENPALCFSVLRMISTDINACWDCMRNLGGVR